MNRREFLKMAAATGMIASFPGFAKANTSYQGKFLVTVYAHGGWDPTSFCDPKMNVAGENIINNWAKTLDTQSAGNIQYAPFADNENFFKTHYKKMLVMNGINVETNSHVRGEMSNLTGSMNDGFPTLSALLAANNKSQELMPWVHNGFRPYSGELLAPSLIGGSGDINNLKKLADTNLYKSGNTSTYLNRNNLDILSRFRSRGIEERRDDQQRLIRQRQQYRNFLSSTYSNESFNEFINLLETADIKGFNRNDGAYRQALYAMSAFKTGSSIAADLRVSNFDTHGNHDVNHAKKLTQLTNTVDLLWHLAEQFGIADRLVVHIASDIGRTNRYNNKNGKDHWSVTSGIIMANNPDWGNRVVGSSDEGHFSHKINLNTLQRDDINGNYLRPRDIMGALRQQMSLENTQDSLNFDLNTKEALDLFNPNKSTA